MIRFPKFFKKLFPAKPKQDEKYSASAPKPKEEKKPQPIRADWFRHSFFGTFAPMKRLPGQRTGREKFLERQRIKQDKRAARYARETMKELRAA